MGSKNQKPVAHTGKKSWWDGSYKSDCGTKWENGNHRPVGWLESYTECPGCKTANKKHDH